MKIELTEVESKAEWEQFVSESGYATSFFQSWNWGRFEQSLGKRAYYLGFELGGELQGIGLAVLVKARRGTFLHFRNGPVLDWSDSLKTGLIFSRIKRFAKDLKCQYVRVSPLVEPQSEGAEFFKMRGFAESQMHDVDAEITWMLDLGQSEDRIQQQMRKNTRYYIRKAEREGVTVRHTDTLDFMDDFWMIYGDTVKRHGWNAYTRHYIESEFEQFAKDGQARMFIADYKGKAIAAAIFIYYNGQVYYHHSGSLSEYRKVPAPYLLQWESIKEAKKRGFRVYNFFGIARDDNPDHPWHGLTFFKKGFGGYEQRWIHAKDKPLSWRYWITHFYEFFERSRRGY